MYGPETSGECDGRVGRVSDGCEGDEGLVVWWGVVAGEGDVIGGMGVFGEEFVWEG